MRPGTRSRGGLLLPLVVAAACGTPTRVEPGAETSLPTPVASTEIDPHAGGSAGAALAGRPEAGRLRALPPEAFMRAYLMWFGGLAPHDVQTRARNHDVLGAWRDELGALGFPDYAADFPRAGQSNAVMAAEIARLGEALCVLAAEHDLHGGRTPVRDRTVFAFAATPGASLEVFAMGFDVLHRTFLGYPLALAPADRLDRFYGLFSTVVAKHAGGTALTADESGWVAVCTALVTHPEASIY